MYQAKQHKRSSKRSGKSAALLVSLLLFLTVTIGGTIAFLMDNDGPLHNLFNPSQVTTKVEETVSDSTKSNVKIQNTGNTDSWIRVAVVVTWQDKQGNIYGKKPEVDIDYEISYNESVQTNPDGRWLKGDDNFWYWSKPVAANSATGVLITSCKQINTFTVSDTTYYLNVEIIGSGIQSKPASVFTEWKNTGLTVDDGNTDPMKWTLIKEVRE